VNVAIKNGAIEVHRGLSATKGSTSKFYAGELIRGAMYPGTQIAFGHGMYFATPSKDGNLPSFPRVSMVARKYTSSPDGTGFLVRAALKKDVKIADCEDIKKEFRENRNRASKAGITDIGAYAASLGIDAFKADGVYTDHLEEVVYVVLNRGKLIVQTTGLSVG
jgi:hypothetical protein